MKKINIILVVLLGTVGFVKAQQQTMFTHYAFNTLSVNPAYAGSREALTFTALTRNQWVGFKGAPITQTLTVHAPIAKNKMGVGLSILNDKIGPLNTTSLYADFAYSIPINDKNKSKLAFGLKSGINLFSESIADLKTDQAGDQAATSGVNKLLPNFGLGAYYHNEKWYAGLSIPRLLENKLSTQSTNQGVSSSLEKRHFFLIGGTVLNLNNNLKLKPTTFLKVVQGAPMELDLTGMFIFKEKLELGAMFRTGDAIGALIGYNIQPHLRIGYSFDWSYRNTTFKYNYGSHELMILYDFKLTPTDRITSPRYF
jgi:type IX secretion system PorP/SprF family membrane protein